MKKTEAAKPLKTQVAAGMRIDWDVPVEMDDGVVLRVDVFRPDDDEEYPVIMANGFTSRMAFLLNGNVSSPAILRSRATPQIDIRTLRSTIRNASCQMVM
jgi:hypothetical protein